MHLVQLPPERKGGEEGGGFLKRLPHQKAKLHPTPVEEMKVALHDASTELGGQLHW
jgi:hypothetical protein